MQFMMLMIPNVYRGNKKLDPGFVPDPKKIEEMTRFNEELGKAVKILSLNGLHPLNTGARVSFGKREPTGVRSCVLTLPIWGHLGCLSNRSKSCGT